MVLRHHHYILAVFPGSDKVLPLRGWYRMCAGVWLLVGVAWYSGVVAALQRQIAELDNSVKTVNIYICNSGISNCSVILQNIKILQVNLVNKLCLS